MMHKWKISMAGALAACFIFAGIASAHVVVSPATAPQGSYQVFSVRVPSETKGTSTTKIKVAVPEGVAVTRTEPKPGWTVQMEKREDGTAVSVTWSAADGKGLSDTEFTDFRMQGKVADDAKQLAWKAYQTYADGSQVDWVGAAGSDKPASVTEVTPAAGGEGDSHGGAADNTAGSGTNAAGDRTALWLSGAAAVLSLISLILSIAFRRKRA